MRQSPDAPVAVFGVPVSSTWTSRLMKKHGIQHKIPQPPKPPKAPKVPEVLGLWVPSDSIPNPEQYPAFRADLQQAATVASAAPASYTPAPYPSAPAAAPAGQPAKRGRPANPNNRSDAKRVKVITAEATPHAPGFEGFGMLRVSMEAFPPRPPMLALPPTMSRPLPPMPVPYQQPYQQPFPCPPPPNFQFAPIFHPHFSSCSSVSSDSGSESGSSSGSSTPSEAAFPIPVSTITSAGSSKAAGETQNAEWEVLKVIELPISGRIKTK